MRMSSNNAHGMDIWKQLARINPAYLKTINAGRLRGKSDVNPQARYAMMTETFGPCGIGWKYTIDRLWTEPGTNGVVFAFALVSVYVKADGAWSDAIPGVGGHQLIEQETKGLHDNDEAFKMATTDALGTAMKMLGVAAEVYLGNWDGSKYVERTEASSKVQTAANKWGTGGSQEMRPADSGDQPQKPVSRLKNWSEMTTGEKMQYTLNRIEEARMMVDPVKATEVLQKIGAGLKGVKFDQTQLDAIGEALSKADQDINNPQ
jgi:hypothetical protein